MTDDATMPEVARDETPEAGLDAGASQAALLLDYQNLHHYLKGRANGSTVDLAGQLLLALRETLAQQHATRVTRGKAYADFGGLDEHTRHVQRSLYLHGIEPVYVPATLHRNTVDLQLAIDAVEARGAAEIQTVVLVSGDRDYAPVVQALLASGTRAVVVGFREHLTPHLLDHTDGGTFIDAETLLPEGSLASSEVGTAIEVTVFAEAQDPRHEINYDALETIEKFFGQYEEIYLTPLLRRLSDEIGEVDGHDPKSLVADLEECGAARLERRRGMPYDYTVLLVNPDHPAVQEVREELRGPVTTGPAAEDDGLPFEEAEL